MNKEFEEDSLVNSVNFMIENKRLKVPRELEVWESLTCDYEINDIFSQEIINGLYFTSKTKMSNREKVFRMREILAPLGVLLVGVGTNRVVFQSAFDSRYVFKIALDDVGRKDSPKEFINQSYLRPFCAKTFKVSSCGTIAISEYVYPFNNKKDFEVFLEMTVMGFLVPFVAGRFAMDDIGFENFMNYGLRKDFGPVLLDYPELFLYDPNKAKCTNIMPDGSMCNGKIDYEKGFMDFVCPKCGQRMKAKDVGVEAYSSKMDDLLKLMKSKNVVRVGEEGVQTGNRRIVRTFIRKGDKYKSKKFDDVFGDLSYSSMRDSYYHNKYNK